MPWSTFFVLLYCVPFLPLVLCTLFCNLTYFLVLSCHVFYLLGVLSCRIFFLFCTFLVLALCIFFLSNVHFFCFVPFLLSRPMYLFCFLTSCDIPSWCFYILSYILLASWYYHYCRMRYVYVVIEYLFCWSYLTCVMIEIRFFSNLVEAYLVMSSSLEYCTFLETFYSFILHTELSSTLNVIARLRVLYMAPGSTSS